MAIINPVNFENRQLDIDSLPRYRGVELSSLNQKYLIKLNIITSAGAILFFYWAWYYIFAYGNLQGFISIFGDFGFANIFGFLLSQLSSTKKEMVMLYGRGILSLNVDLYTKKLL